VASSIACRSLGGYFVVSFLLPVAPDELQIVEFVPDFCATLSRCCPASEKGASVFIPAKTPLEIARDIPTWKGQHLSPVFWCGEVGPFRIGFAVTQVLVFMLSSRA